MACAKLVAAFLMCFPLAVCAKSPAKVHIMTFTGISGQGLDFKNLMVKLDELTGEKAELVPIYMNYTTTIEIGIDAYALKAMQVLHSHVDLFDKHSRYILIAHSAGGAVLSRLLDLLMNGETLVLGSAGHNAILTGELDCYLQRKPMKECAKLSYKRNFTLPVAVVDMEPSMLYFDVTSRKYSEKAEQKLKNFDFEGLLNEDYNTTGNWAYDLWAKMDVPEDAGWITNAIKNKGWTWSMFRGLSESLVHWCPESNPQVAFIAQYIKEGGNYTYVVGSKTDNLFRGGMAKLVLEKEYGLKAVVSEWKSEGKFSMGNGKDFGFHVVPHAGHNMYADNLLVTTNMISAGLANDLPHLFEWIDEQTGVEDNSKDASGLTNDNAAAIIYS